MHAQLLSGVWLFTNPCTVAARLLCPGNIPSKNTGVGGHFLLQGIFPTQGSNPCLLHLLCWQVGSFPPCCLGSPSLRKTSVHWCVSRSHDWLSRDALERCPPPLWKDEDKKGTEVMDGGVRLWLFSHSVMSDSLRPHGLKNARLPCPPLSPGLCSNSVEFIHWVSDDIQPSHPLSTPSSSPLNLSQHQGLFQWVSSSHQVAKVLELQL